MKSQTKLVYTNLNHHFGGLKIKFVNRAERVLNILTH